MSEVLALTVKNINSKRGTMVDNITQLRGAQLNGRVIDVDYAVTKRLQLSGARFASAAAPVLRRNLCGVGPDAAIISSGGSYRFNYRYENGRNVGTVVIDHC